MMDKQVVGESKSIRRGDRTHDHTVKSRALYRTELAGLIHWPTDVARMSLGRYTIGRCVWSL